MPYIIPQEIQSEFGARNVNINNPDAKQAFGIISDDGMPVESAYHYRNGRCLTDAEELTMRYNSHRDYTNLPGKWFYGGIFFPHFGHFVTESIHRLRSYCATPENYKGIVFLKSPHGGTFSYNPLELEYVRIILLEYFKINPENILFTDSFLQVDSLQCDPQDQTLGGAPNKDYIDYLGAKEVKFLEDFHACDINEKIFLSRQNYLKFGRTLGMNAVQKVYQENGYVVIFPETMSIKEQVGILNGAKKVVCEAGSSLHLFDFIGSQDCELSIISRRGFDAQYWRNMYQSRVKKLSVFERVLPMHEYFDTIAGNGHSLLHIQFLFSFMRDSDLKFDDEKLMVEIRNNVRDDLEKMGLTF